MLSGITSYLLEAVLTFGDNAEFALRIVFAAFRGLLVGIERSRRLKGAGMRTHCIIAMTAAVFMILSKYAFMDLDIDAVPGIRGADSARIAAQVVSGISFLGAGIIFKQGRNSVHGLTTAAGMWATAAIGMAVGAGMIWVGITESVLLILLQIVLHSPRFDIDSLTEQKLELRCSGEIDAEAVFGELLKKHASIVDHSAFTKEGETTVLTITARSHRPLNMEEVLKFTKQYPGFCGIRLQDV